MKRLKATDSIRRCLSEIAVDEHPFGKNGHLNGLLKLGSLGPWPAMILGGLRVGRS